MATGRIGTTPVLQVRWSKAPAGGTTSLSGLDDNSVSLVYSVGYEAVYRNGVLLSRGNDYTATNGTTITLIDATITGDIIEVFANQTIPLSDTYSQTVADGKFINNTLTTTTGDIIYASAANTPARLGIGSTGNVLTVSGGVPAWAAPSASLEPYCSVNANATNITDNVATEVIFGNENFDSGSAYNTANGRFTPQSSGKYYVVVTLMLNANGADIWHQGQTQIRKNGTELARTSADGFDNYANYEWPLTCASIVECNGTTDYISAFALLNVTAGGNPQYGAASRMVIFRIGA